MWDPPTLKLRKGENSLLVIFWSNGSNILLTSLSFEVWDEGAEGVELWFFVGKSEKELVDVVLQVFGKGDVDDLEVFDVAGTGAGDEVAEAGEALEEAFLVGARVDDFIEPQGELVAVPGGGVDEFGEAAGGDDKNRFTPEGIDPPEGNEEKGEDEESGDERDEGTKAWGKCLDDVTCCRAEEKEDNSGEGDKDKFKIQDGFAFPGDKEDGFIRVLAGEGEVSVGEGEVVGFKKVHGGIVARMGGLG